MAEQGKLKEAMKEAYLHKPEVAYLFTLEIIHPEVKTSGVVTPIRIVKNTNDIVAPLEASAPYNAGENVTFTAVNFDLILPTEKANNATPEMDLTIDNVTQKLRPYLDIACYSLFDTTIILRPYLMDSLTSGVQMELPPRMILTSVNVTLTTITGKCRLQVMGDKDFLTAKYTKDKFPSLYASE